MENLPLELIQKIFAWGLIIFYLPFFCLSEDDRNQKAFRKFDLRVTLRWESHLKLASFCLVKGVVYLVANLFRFCFVSFPAVGLLFNHRDTGLFSLNSRCVLNVLAKQVHRFNGLCVQLLLYDDRCFWPDWEVLFNLGVLGVYCQASLLQVSEHRII